MSSPILLILGSGPNIGQHVSNTFSQHGFRVAQASRTRKFRVISETRMDLEVDLASGESLAKAFRQVRDVWGHPSVVVYNGASVTRTEMEAPHKISIADVERDMSVNAINAFHAIQLAVEGFLKSPDSTFKTFIYTGNKLNVMPSPNVLVFGMGKAAAAHMLWDSTIAYRNNGFKFYYTDERLEDGSPARDKMNGHYRGLLYHQLAIDSKQHRWHYTFMTGKGYVDFEEVDKTAAKDH